MEFFHEMIYKKYPSIKRAKMLLLKKSPQQQQQKLTVEAAMN